VEHAVSLVKHEVFRLAMKGETIARTSCNWASSKAELESLAKEEKQVREQVKEIFKDSIVDVETVKIGLVFYEFWEIVIKVNWG
jgi:hypothetical protein